MIVAGADFLIALRINYPHLRNCILSLLVLEKNIRGRAKE